MFGNDGRLTGIDYNGEQFEISYISSSGVGYTGEIKPSGEVTKLERATVSVDYTDVWANYFEKDGEATLVYTTSSLGNSYNGITDWDVVKNWNLTNGMANDLDVPWYYDKSQSEYVFDDFKVKIKHAVIENIIPENTKYLFYGLSGLTEQIEGLNNILSSISKIDEGMFYNVWNLGDLVIPSNITEIGKDAFRMCMNLKSVTLEGVKTIGDEAFSQCLFDLKSITISNSIENIGNDVFSYCNALREIKIKKEANSIEGSPWGAPNSAEIKWEP